MKATELRIGNLIQDDNGLKTVSMIYCHDRNPKDKYTDIMFYEADGYFSLEYLYPIELTEEWLIKAGFEKISGINNRYVIDYGAFNFSLLIQNDNKSYHTTLSNHEFKQDYPIVGLGIIKHVHQLQNLYFALTGEELTIKT